MTHYSQDGAAYRMSTGPPGRWTEPAEWRALGEDLARAGRIRALVRRQHRHRLLLRMAAGRLRSRAPPRTRRRARPHRRLNR